MQAVKGPTDDIEPAPPYEPPHNFTFAGYGHAQGYSGGAHPAPDNFTLDRAVHPEIPGFYDEYGNHHMKMMELNAKRNVQLRRQLHQEETQGNVTIKTRKIGSHCGIIFFFILSLILVGGFLALVVYAVSSRNK